jgi:hypothetical protein
MSADPVRLVWDALEARDCRPHGRAFDFRARCPAHGGDNRSSLHVGVGADGRAVLWCFAHQCTVEAIVDALGIAVADLFPDGHQRAHRLPPRPVRRSDFTGPAHTVATVLYALEKAEQPWRLMLVSDCPYCGSPGAWLRARSPGHVLPNGLHDVGGAVDVDCPDGCDSDNYVQALLARLKENTT